MLNIASFKKIIEGPNVVTADASSLLIVMLTLVVNAPLRGN